MTILQQLWSMYIDTAKSAQIQTPVQIFLGINTIYFILSSFYETRKIKNQGYTKNLDNFRTFWVFFNNFIYCIAMLPVANSAFITFLELSNLLPLLYRFHTICSIEQKSYIDILWESMVEYATTIKLNLKLLK